MIDPDVADAFERDGFAAGEVVVACCDLVVRWRRGDLVRYAGTP